MRRHLLSRFWEHFFLFETERVSRVTTLCVDAVTESALCFGERQERRGPFKMFAFWRGFVERLALCFGLFVRGV